MENENEILELEVTLNSGEVVQIQVQESEYWDEIEKGSRALIVLMNGQQMLVEINEADEDEGVSFKVIGDKNVYHHDAGVVTSIYVECKP